MDDRFFEVSRQMDELIDRLKAIAPRDWNEEFLTLISAQEIEWVGRMIAAGLTLRIHD